MAESKATPRQKMIGMMYLVLTALLALNVSKDLLNAFVVINERISHTDEVLQAKNSGIMAQFETQMSIDPKKTAPYFEKARHVTRLASESHEKIDALKTHLITASAGYDEQTPDSLYELRLVDKKDDYDTPTEVLIGSDPAFPKQGAHSALELKSSIEALKQELLTLFDAEQDQEVIEKIQGNLSLDPVPNAEGKLEPWEVGNFYHLPLAACITNLSKLQSDIRAAEGEALSALYSNVSANDYKFDTIAARIIPKSNYVLLGEPFEAQLFLAAFSTTEQPVMTIHRGDRRDSIPVVNGLGQVNLPTQREGLQTFSGNIQMKLANNQVKSFPYEGAFLVAKPSLTVAPTKMMVLYKGVENPLSISVPGIPSEHLQATITGGNTLKASAAGTYTVKPVNTSPRQVEVRVSMVDEDGSTKSLGTQSFAVKNLPAPFAQIGNIQGSGRMRANELKAQQGIKAAYDPSFVFQLSAQVRSFEMTTFYRGQVVGDESDSPFFTPKMKEIMGSLRSGTVVTFQNIKARGTDGVEHELGPINITIQ